MRGLFLVLLLAGCAGRSGARVSTVLLPCPSGGLQSEPLPASVVPPRPKRAFVPPLPIPADVLGTRGSVRLVIDEQGRPFADSVTVCGIRNRQYAGQLLVLLAQTPFEPARRDGQPVIAPVLIQYAF